MIACHRQRVRERAYALWEEHGRQHENDWADWFRAEVEIPLRVTFDSNTYRQVVDPTITRDASSAELRKINDALRAGRIRAYLSDTIITLEGIENKDRVQVLGSSRLDFQTQTTGKNTITTSLSMEQNRKPLHPVTSKWIQAAEQSGMRFMRTGSRWFSGAGHIRDDDSTYYEPEEVLALADRMERVNKVAEAIQARGLGYAAAVSLGLQFSARNGAVDEWWLRGLQRVRNQIEEEEVQKAIREWADADSIAAHVGYENDVFCTRDAGKGAKVSVLTPENRRWLTATYGVRFATLPELSQKL